MYTKKENLVIRSAEVKDATVLNQWWNDGAVMEHAGFPNGLGQSLEETIDKIKAYKGKLSQLCILEVDGVTIGEASYGLFDNIAEIGIKICDFSYQNQGHGSKFLRMLITFLFEDERINASEYAVNKIILDTNLKNERAQHVYEKLGFNKVRVNYGAWKNQLGELQDSVDYEMTREQYHASPGIIK